MEEKQFRFILRDKLLNFVQQINWLLYQFWSKIVCLNYLDEKFDPVIRNKIDEVLITLSDFSDKSRDNGFYDINPRTISLQLSLASTKIIIQTLSSFHNLTLTKSKYAEYKEVITLYSKNHTTENHLISLYEFLESPNGGYLDLFEFISLCHGYLSSINNALYLKYSEEERSIIIYTINILAKDIEHIINQIEALPEYHS